MKKILLYSGGLDSWLIDKIWKPDIKLYVDINGSYSKEEMDKLPEDVIIEHLDLSKWELDNKIVPLRNLYFIMVASNYATGDKYEQYEICLGATAGDRVLDKSVEFANKATDMLNYLYQEQWWTDEKKFRINLDFKDFTKKELLEQFLSMGGQLDDAFYSSFSCYNPTEEGTECWSCKPCFRKFVTFFMMGKSYGKEIEESVYYYLKKNIVPKIAAGNYGRGEVEEANIMTTYSFLKFSHEKRVGKDGKV